MRFRMLRGLVLGCVESIGLSGVATADPGDLDPTSGGDGLVEVPGRLGSPGGSLALAPQNGLWLAGSDMNPCCGTDTTAAITRLRSNGKLDNGFGDGGQIFWSYNDEGLEPVTSGGKPDALAGGGIQVAGDWRANG